MRRLFNKQNETGFATVIVIVIIVVMGLLLAGLIPLGTTVTQSAAYTRNTLQAQYLAEAGAKRAIVELSAGTYSSPLTGSNMISSSGVGNSYSVIITPPSPLTNGSSTVNGDYTVSSTGTYGKFSKSVTVTVTIDTGTFPNISADFLIGGSIINQTPNTLKIGNNGRVTINGTKDNTIILENDVLKYFSTQKFEIPAIDFTKAMADSTAFTVPTFSGEKDVTLDAGTKTVYSYSDTNGLTIGSASNNCSLQGASSGYSVVVINGDLTWDASAININGNVLFLVNGDVHINTTVSMASCCFYCNNLYVGDSGANFGAKLIVRENLYLSTSLSNVNYISAFTDLSSDLPTLVPSSGTIVSNWAKKT
jgi:Tfp pilus assembly protein PilX